MSLIDHYSYLPTYPLTSGLAYCADYSEIPNSEFFLPTHLPLVVPPTVPFPGLLYTCHPPICHGKDKESQGPEVSQRIPRGHFQYRGQIKMDVCSEDCHCDAAGRERQ